MHSWWKEIDTCSEEVNLIYHKCRGRLESWRLQETRDSLPAAERRCLSGPAHCITHPPMRAPAGKRGVETLLKFQTLKFIWPALNKLLMPEASPSISGWTTQEVSVFDGSGTCPHVLPGSKPLNPPLTCSPPPTLRLVPTLCHLSALAGFLLRFCCSLGKVATLNQRLHRTRVGWGSWSQWGEGRSGRWGPGPTAGASTKLFPDPGSAACLRHAV